MADTTNTKFTPFVPATQVMRDFNAKTVIIGVLFGCLFGSANAYLGLKVGLTVSTAVPLAVISVVVFRLLSPLWGKATILEFNISQTAGSASSSVAAGVIFTLPALFMWSAEGVGEIPSLLKMVALGMTGAVLGILLMIPLRRFLIVREHHTLPYPEGTASAQVLIAAEKGGTRARPVFIGMLWGAVFKALCELASLWPAKFAFALPKLKKAVFAAEVAPALVGVGYILGYRISAIMVAGGVISALVLTPLIAHFGPMFATSIVVNGQSIEMTIGAMSARQVWYNFVRPIGAGAVACAGIITVIRSLPMMIEALKGTLRGVTQKGRQAAAQLAADQRTDRDLPGWALGLGIGLVIISIVALPFVAGEDSSGGMRFVVALAVVLFAYLFVAVASRIVGMIGVSSNPTSGMTIVTLLFTAGIFYALGWTSDVHKTAALTVGTVVCVAASISGDISQDLKTGYLLGATPWKQQISEIIGAIVSAGVICYVVKLLGTDPATGASIFGSEAVPAPQGTLMKTMIDGVLSGNLPWELILAGAAIAGAAAVMGLPALPFAVGLYLPLATMVPVYAGGVIRYFVEERITGNQDLKKARKEKGILFGSGLIAGEGVMGVLIAVYAFLVIKLDLTQWDGFFGKWWETRETGGNIAAVAIFTIICVLLLGAARKTDQ
ncbi:MAG: oligopeptide transporter, OPT family [Myxococcota bacterium]|nr:oligopeptide transporter, OPT family [Myxococcota bacterium]